MWLSCRCDINFFSSQEHLDTIEGAVMETGMRVVAGTHELQKVCRVMPHIWVSHVTHFHCDGNGDACGCWYSRTAKGMPSHVTHMSESCHTDEWVVSHIWMSHVTQMNGSCYTCECAMSHIWMRHVARMNASCHTYKWVMLHIWMSHVTHMNASCHTHEWFMSQI